MWPSSVLVVLALTARATTGVDRATHDCLGALRQHLEREAAAARRAKQSYLNAPPPLSASPEARLHERLKRVRAADDTDPARRCLDLRFDRAVPKGHVRRVCHGCLEHACHFAAFSRWSSARPRVPSGFAAFEKVYVIHYSPRAWRRERMLERLRDAGVPVDADAGVVSFVDAFDAPSFTEAELQCLRQSARLAPHAKYWGKMQPAPPHSPQIASVDTKNYAALLDMLRHGFERALIVEDDAAFAPGAKRVGGGEAWFATGAAYKNASFKRALENMLVPRLPTRARRPEGFRALDEPTRGAPGGGAGRALRGAVETAPSFDVLMLGGCDTHWRDFYDYGRAHPPRRGPQALMRGEIFGAHSWAGGARAREPASASHLATARECSRCAQAYIVSRDGAARLLSAGALPFAAAIDAHLGWVSRENRTERRPLDCLWAEPPLVWEDPGLEGDGLPDAGQGRDNASAREPRARHRRRVTA